jgi:hypothetical protein
MAEQVGPKYPRWRYHATKPATLVESDKDEKALGGGWFDNPAQAKPSIQPPTPQEQIAAAKAAEDKAAADAKAKPVTAPAVPFDPLKK